MRLRVPDAGETVVEDLIHGPVRFPNASYDDFVIARADGTVLYNFAVAVDDAEMGITEVVRGDDHLSNTPKQLLVLEALGHAPPRYAHLPLLHGPDGKKLSKRHGAASVQELRDSGYLPAAVRNYLALLGWGAADDETILSTEELVRRFEVADVGKAAAIFDERKLRWLNGRYMREMPLDDYVAAVARHLGRQPDERLRAACEIAQEKAQTLAEVWPLDPLPLRAAGRRPESVEEGDEARGRGAARGRRRGARRRRSVRARVDRGGPGAVARAFRAEGGQALPADPGRNYRQLGLAGDLRVAGSPRARGERATNPRRARTSCRPATGRMT